MRLEGESESENVSDRRGLGGGRGQMMVGGGFGTLILLLVVWLLGGNPMQLLNPGGPNAPPGQVNPGDPELKTFVSKVLSTTERVWRDEFRKRNRVYTEPTLVLFSGGTDSACGFAGSATGPFYCPGDHQIYLDLSFFKEMKRRFHATGDFAQAYVIAHEVGHHVQNLMGITDQIHGQQGRLSKSQYNQLSVRLELQADFLAGVWANHTQDKLEPGDIEEGLNAANAIGDDRLQQAQGHVVPDSFTHGTSAQRVRWFTKGFRSGKIEDGDTFDVPYERL